MKKIIPEVSVVMSVFNGERFLSGSVDSILNQTFNYFEFIIINDGSTDGTREILESYNDDRIILIHQNNTGLTKALNRGISLARGEYIARMDADDASRTDRLEKQVDFLRDNPEIVLLGSSFYKIDEDGKVVEQANLPTEEVKIKWDLLFYNSLGHSNVMFRREEVNSLEGYNDTVRYAQDYDLWFRIAERYPVANLKEPLFYYRIPMEGTITYGKASDQKQQAEQIYLGALNSLKPGVVFRKDEIKNLRDFIITKGEIKDVNGTEKLFLKTYTSFCDSTFVAKLDKNKLKTIKIEPYIKLAWAYFNRGIPECFNRCINGVIDSGFQGPFDIPTDKLHNREKYIIKALIKYFFTGDQKMGQKNRGKDFLQKQYLHFAWKYFSIEDMKKFRRCLLVLFRNCPSVRWLILWLKSFLGRKAMGKLNRLKVIANERL